MKHFLSALIIALFTHHAVAGSESKITFWDSTQYGANSFNKMPPNTDYFNALKQTGATWVRLTFSKWQGQKRDFLMGDMGNYTGLVESDFAVLKQVLDNAHTAGVRVVLVPLGLPGNRWKQNNKGKFDDRLWTNPAYAKQAVQFWQDLATRLHNHPAIVAYNLINEPAPELKGGGVENDTVANLMAWNKKHRGTPRDLYTLYTQIIAGIRTVDTQTPIMVDSGWYANPKSLGAWEKPLADDKVLYAFHMYEPWVATSTPNRKRVKQGKPPHRYPSTIKTPWGTTETWDKSAIHAHLNPAFVWAKQHNISTNRIVMSEFGCIRDWVDCGTYLTDVLDTANKHNAHWAWYTFRPDEWDAMDYELPTTFAMGLYYWYMETNKKLPRNGELIKLIKSKMQ